MSDDDKPVIFRRIRGRIVPIRARRDQPNFFDPEAVNLGVSTGLVAGVTAKAKIDKVQALFQTRAKKFSKLSTHYGSKDRPRMPIGAPKKTRGKKLKFDGVPDIFEKASYKKRMKYFKSAQAKTTQFATAATHFGKKARFLKKFGLAGAVGAGLVAGSASYLSKVYGDDDNG